MKLSIIVPVYNKEKYLIKCLNSIFSQKTHFEFEVIAVDDCSMDKSLDILKKYSITEERLSIIEHQENKGQAIARASGMKIAMGDYVTHIDADDWILKGALNDILLKIKEYNPDVLLLNTYIQYEGRKRFLNEYFHYKGFLNKENPHLRNIQPAFYQHSGTKVVRRELTDDLLVNSNQFETTAEDFLYCFEVFLKAKTFYCLPSAYYVVNVNSDSLTQLTESYKQMNNQIILLNLLKGLIDKYQPDSSLINDMLLFREKATINLALNCWLEGHGKEIKGCEIIEGYQIFSEISPDRLNSMQKSLQTGLGAMYFSSKFRGYLSTLCYIIKFKALRLIKK